MFKNYLSLIIILCFLFGFALELKAQTKADSSNKNLVSNPSFEELNNCPTDYGMIDEASEWIAVNFTPDLFNVCAAAEKPAIGVPYNFFGKQNAATGQGYAGILVYHENSPFELIATKLIEPIKKGERYLVSFKASLAEEYSNFACNNLGVLFSNDPTTTLNTKKAHIKSRRVLQATQEWFTLADTILADEDYEYLVIGNFYGKEDTETKKLQNAGYPAAYYYIDDVLVSKAPRKDKKQEFIKIFGKVLDSESKKPLEARIDFVLSNIRYRAYEDTDEKTGFYQFSKMLLNPFFVLEAKATGYFSALEYIHTQDQRVFERNFKLKPCRIGSTLILENVFFDTDRATIKAESNVVLDMVANFLKENSNYFVEIAGHTDNTGTPEKNLQLSEDRAEAVVRYLVEKGAIERNRLDAKGYGDSKALASNDSEEGKQRNRRVELKILK